MKRGSAKRRRRLRAFICAAGLGLILLLLPARFTAPARTVFTEVSSPAAGAVFTAAGDAMAGTGTVREAFVEQERARAAEQYIDELKNRNVQLKEMVMEREKRLRNREDLDPGGEFSVKGARVVGYDTSSSRDSFVIRIGRREGVRDGLAVLTAGGYVGRISETGPWHSRVRLLTDPDSRISCRVQRTRHPGMLQGTGTESCEMEWIKEGADVRKGDVLVTAPMDRKVGEEPLIPAGLPAARVVSAGPDERRPLFREVTARPAVNTSRVEWVEVALPKNEQ